MTRSRTAGAPKVAPNKRGAETREKLIDATIDLVVEWGPDAVNLRDIGRECDQKNNSVCQFHYGTKDNILAVALERVMGDVLDRTPHEGRAAEFVARMVASKQWAHLVWEHPRVTSLPAEVVRRRVCEAMALAFVKGRV